MNVCHMLGECHCLTISRFPVADVTPWWSISYLLIKIKQVGICYHL